MQHGLLLLAAAAVGCPSAVEPSDTPKAAAVAPAVDSTDPRPPSSGPAKGRRAKGSGKPDETNGYCRLYAPELPEPHCCTLEYGFDARAAATSCAQSMYLGESFQRSCGYYFLDGAGTSTWFRTSIAEEDTPHQAATAEARRLNARLGRTDITATPVPGVEAAYWVRGVNGLSWAWLGKEGGWPRVRRLAWRDTSCRDEGVTEILTQMVAARAPLRGQPRPGLVPTAR